MFMLNKILNFALVLGIWQTAEAQLSGVNTNFDSHYYFSNNYNRAEGGVGSNGGSVSFVTDRFGAGNSAFQNTKESGVVVDANANRAYTDGGFTFAAWINPTNFTMNPGICTGVGTFNNTFDIRMIVEAANTTTPFDKDFRIFLKNGALSYEFNTSDGLYTNTFTKGNKPSLNVWQHIAISTQSVSIPNVGLGKKIIYYLNGVAQDSVTYGSNFNFIFTGKAMEFGATNTMGVANCGNTFQSFQGSLDDFTLLSRGLSNEEVKQVYDAERIPSNLEISSLLNKQFAYYPINYYQGVGGNDFRDYALTGTSIQQIVPTTYAAQASGNNRYNAILSTLTQGTVNASASTNFNGYRIANGNKYIKPDSTLTIALWAKNNGTTWNNTTLIDATNNIAANFKWIVNNSGNMVVYLGSTMHTFTSLNLALNTWTHLAVSIDGKNKNVRLYINGQLANTYSTANKFIIPNNNDGDIFLMTSPMYYQNGYWQGGGNGFVGNLDEIRFFKTALDAKEVIQIMSPTGKIKPIINVKTNLVYGDYISVANASYSNFDTTVFKADGYLLRTKSSGTSSVTISVAATDSHLSFDTTLTVTIGKKEVSIIIITSNWKTVPYGSPAPSFTKLTYNGILNDADTLSISGAPQWTNLDKTEVGTYDIVYSGGLSSPLYTFVDGGSINEYTIAKAPTLPAYYDSLVVFGDTFDLVKFAPNIAGEVSYGITQDINDPILKFENGKLIALRSGSLDVNTYFNPTSSNYLPYSKYIKITVNPAPIIITVNNQMINYGFNIDNYYDAFNNSGSYTVSGLKNEQTLGGFYHNYITPQVTTNYNPTTSPRGTYTLTIDTAQYKIDAGANVYRFYKIVQINIGELTLTGNKYQNISGLTACKSCGGGIKGDIARVSKGGDGECVPTFRDRNPNETSFTINGLISQDIMGENTGLPVVYEIVSGPCTVSGNTFTLTGAEGTVQVHIFANRNADYWDSDKDGATFVCFDVSSTVVNGIDDIELNNPIKVYPNPVKDVLFVNDKAEIFNLLGEKVLEGNHQIDVSNLSNGVYLVKIKNTITKIIKD